MDKLIKKRTEEKNWSFAPTFFSELDRQCKKIIYFAFAISFTWLFYIPVDTRINENALIIIILRLGLPVSGIISIVTALFSKMPNKNVISLMFFSSYLTIAAAVITGLSGGNPAYIGGFLFILILLAVGPFPAVYSWITLFVSYITFIIIFLLGKPQFTDTLSYSIRDSLNVVIVDAVFIFLLNKLRHESWKKSIEIEKEREVSNELLLNILPDPIAHELQKFGVVKPVYHNSATVVFTDFVGFTWISEILDPETLIKKLDCMFQHFDHIIDKYHLEKLKTIGDSYMYAGGLPDYNKTHAIDAVLAALEIVRFVHSENEKLRGKASPTWEIRIGVNTGGMMSGIVGRKKFIYDIWGDSVNTASRLESSGVKGMVNIGEGTYEIVKDFFNIDNRGMISVKNKGEIQMYLVRGIKKELSLNEAGIEPNEKFCRMYCEIKKSESEVQHT